MAKCDHCGATILFGGKKEGNLRFCNDSCYQVATLLSVSDEIPLGVIEEHVREVHEGACPKCHGRGPVDIHVAHYIWSALFLTSSGSKPQMSCRFCGIKSKITNAIGCLLLGWWGIPWGILLTPVQFFRNVIGCFRQGPDPGRPSEELKQHIRMHLASYFLEQREKQNP